MVTIKKVGLIGIAGALWITAGLSSLAHAKSAHSAVEDTSAPLIARLIALQKETREIRKQLCESTNLKVRLRYCRKFRSPGEALIGEPMRDRDRFKPPAIPRPLPVKPPSPPCADNPTKLPFCRKKTSHDKWMDGMRQDRTLASPLNITNL